MIKAVFYDLDGTLVDSEKHYTSGTKTWLQRKGYDLPIEKIFPIIGKNMEETYEYLASVTGLSIEEIEEANVAYFDEENVIDYAEYVFPDVKDTLIGCHERGIANVICSGSQSFLIEKFIKDCKLEGLFDDYVSSDQHFKDKPDPEMYLYLLKRLDLNEDECIVAEDSYNGILSSKKAGIYTVARDASVYHIDQRNADRIVKDLRELWEVIDERNDQNQRR